MSLEPDLRGEVMSDRTRLGRMARSIIGVAIGAVVIWWLLKR